MMYKYLLNTSSATQLDIKTRKEISENLKKRRIFSNIIEFSSEKELSKILTSISKQTTNTLVIIGDDLDFNLLIGQIGKIDPQIVIGYLPIKRSRISKKLKIGSISSAVEALSQRKINEMPIYSISSRFFYDQISIDFENGSKANEIIIRNDKNLELQVPICTIKVENLNEDNFFANTPIQLNAVINKKGESNDNKTNPIIKKIQEIIKKTNNSEQEELILSLHAKNFKIESELITTDNLGRKYNQSFGIGRASRNLRLISKRPDVQK